MANPALLDIDMSAVDFAAAHAELLTLKLDNQRTRPDADSKLRAIAAWANYVDDCALAFQSRLQEHATAIADLEGAVTALEADPGVTDHGALTGLADNDHPQYLLAAGVAPAIVGVASRVVSSEFRLDQQGTIAPLVDGAQNLTDTASRVLAGTVANSAAAATWRITSGSGLQYAADATNSVYQSTTRTACNFEWSMQALYDLYGVDATWDMLVRVYVTTQTFPNPNTGTAGLVMGIRGVSGTPSNAGARFRGMIRRNQGGVDVMNHATEASGGANYILPGTLPNVYGVQYIGQQSDVVAGTWSTNFDGSRCGLSCGHQNLTNTGTTTMRDGQNVFALALGSGNTNASTVITVERIRFDFRSAW